MSLLVIFMQLDRLLKNSWLLYSVLVLVHIVVKLYHRLMSCHLLSCNFVLARVTLNVLTDRSESNDGCVDDIILLFVALFVNYDA